MKKHLLAILFGLCAPFSVSAHAFGQQYTLPLPVWMYVFGGGAAVIVSFLLIGYFATQANPKNLENTKTIQVSPFFFLVLKALGLLFFVITIVAGIIGSQEPSLNFAPIFVWIIFLLGFTYLTAIAGNLWQFVNPWQTIASWLENKKHLEYPAWLGYYPALIAFFIVIWLELLSDGSAVVPVKLAVYLLWYTGISLFGSALFGIKSWFKYGDFFSVFFQLIAKLSPVAYEDGKIILRWPLAGLLISNAKKVSILLFIIFMLSSTAFDGFRETGNGVKISFDLSFIQSFQIRQTVMLIGAFILFLICYYAAVVLIKLFVKSQHTIKDLALAFAYSLIPIALAYNLAHYFTLFLVQGQDIIPIIFGNENYTVNVGIIGAKAVWQSQVAFILIGHIAAVYVAHVKALQIFNNHKQAILSQLPMLALMVAYTMAGLWILSQPLALGV